MAIANGRTLPLGTPKLMDMQFEQTAMPVPVAFARIGGLGFQFEGGLITVNALTDRVEVSFDRMMTYDGTYTQVPGGTPYTIGQPTMDLLTARYLSIPIAVTPVTPVLTAVNPNTSGTGIQLVFNNDVTVTAPTFGAPSGKLSVLTATGPTASSIQLGISVAPPILNEVAPNATGLLAVFDVPMAVSGSLILDPPYNGLIATGATVPLTDRIQFALTVPVAGATASTLLLSSVAANNAIVLTFNKNVALSTIGQLPASYTITTSTPGAVVPTVTSITVNLAVVTIHTTEQTNGAAYTVTVSPGSIYAA